MKKLVFMVAGITLSIAAIAQSRTTMVEYSKINRQAVINEIPFPEKTVRNAIDNKMEQSGYKGKESKGYNVYKGVRLAGMGTEALDLYFMVDRKSKKEKDIAMTKDTKEKSVFDVAEKKGKKDNNKKKQEVEE